MTATTRMTFGTLLGTVTDAANSVSTTLKTVTLTVGMAHTYVEDAATKQKMQSIAERDTFAEQVSITLAMKEAERKDEVRNYCANNKEKTGDFKEAYDRIKAKLALAGY
jgi:hypothetical protein